MIRLTQLAVAKRSVTVLITLGLLLARRLLVVVAQAGAAARHPVPVHRRRSRRMPGASAQDVSTQVTEPVERSIGSVPRLEHVNSSSVNSLSIVVASFAYGTNIKETKATIDANVKALGLTYGTPTIQSFDINAFPSLIVAITGTGSTTTDQLNALARDDHRARPSQGLDGVSKVDLSGAIPVPPGRHSSIRPRWPPPASRSARSRACWPPTT